ncbi:EPIDERMAL PATTERNING FACTOR-like protein 9 isoform X1 [Capsella rubella]|uniref:EPIDERMAL PATTERNING FACTOR-like protein 9 isoform X1 n=1 Tax=Capsella rubella TaxID=81985 RepID=UPI000CD4F2B8|nr:EPIDERMAL PATTERNING FACTOR-like protein 9 isoform X1 [Capsella rubella]
MKHEMVNIKLRYISIFFLLFALLLGNYVVQASRPRSIENTVSLLSQVHLVQKSRRRNMIGSTAPTCTYNECRGCRYKCRAEQVPVEGNDPINSAYHYRCVCHR